MSELLDEGLKKIAEEEDRLRDLRNEIGNSLLLAVMMGIPYSEARQWSPGDMPSWVQKRWLEREPTTAMELSQAKEWRRETLYWVDTKLASVTEKYTKLMGQKSQLLKMQDGPDLEDVISALKQFQIRLTSLSRMKQIIKKEKGGRTESYMIEVFNEKALIEEYRAR